MREAGTRIIAAGMGDLKSGFAGRSRPLRDGNTKQSHAAAEISLMIEIYRARRGAPSLTRSQTQLTHG
jgi:hypothetical protein